MLQKVAFTMLPVVDPERARAFYEGKLGLARSSAAAGGNWTEYDLPGGGCLALFRGEISGLKPSATGAAIAFEVEDLDAINARLKAEGVEYASELVESPVCRMSVILDSEGNSLILHELRTKPASA